jgi:hypothetical protein
MRGDDCVIQTDGHDQAPFLASSILTVIDWLVHVVQNCARCTAQLEEKQNNKPALRNLPAAQATADLTSNRAPSKETDNTERD